MDSEEEEPVNIRENKALYEQKQTRYAGIQDENSNEGLLQLTVNVDAKSKKYLADKKEVLSIKNEWMVKDVALDFRILRKKNVWFTILYQWVEKFSTAYTIPDEWMTSRAPAERTFIHRGENIVINSNHLVGIQSPPLLRWFSNLCQHLMEQDLSSRNITLASTIGQNELGSLASTSHQAQQKFLRMEALQKEKSLTKDTNVLCIYGLHHIMTNTINGLATEFATTNNLKFAQYKAAYKKSMPLFQNTNTTGTQTLDRIILNHNLGVGNRLANGGRSINKMHLRDTPGDTPYGTPLTPSFDLQEDTTIRFAGSPDTPIAVPTIEEVRTATFYDAIFAKTPEGVPVSRPVIPLDVLLDTEAAVERVHEREPAAEEGWEELAKEFLPLHDLDPGNYGISTTPSPTTEEMIPETPPSQMPSTPISREESEEGGLFTPEGTYEILAVHEHDHNPIDASDIADATEAAIIHLEEERNDPENLTGGEFLITPAQFVSDILENVTPAIVTPYNTPADLHLDEPTQPNAGLSDEHPDTPPRIDTSEERLPSISEIIPATEPLTATPPTARVHHKPEHCNKIADKFIRAWRKAKGKLYRKYGLRHFNINRALFQSGAVCHRCYQLVRKHHELYHLHNGKEVTHTVYKYPRKRQEIQMDRIRTNKKTEVYKETRKKAKAYTKKLTEKNATQLRRYNKQLK